MKMSQLRPALLLVLLLHVSSLGVHVKGDEAKDASKELKDDVAINLENYAKATEDAERARRAILTAKNDLKAAEAKASVSGASKEDKKAAEKAKKDLAAAEADYTAKDNAVKKAKDEAGMGNSESEKSVKSLLPVGDKSEKAAGVTDSKPDKVVKSAVVSDGGVGHGKDKPSATRTVEGTKPDTATPKAKTDKTVESATAILSTIPAVLITSVVFLYFYNW
eukprot:Tbor_TRINITY_DN5959_c3_g5::TRINITY_DN5959_c3_g5_i1::g.18163::m.18163